MPVGLLGVAVAGGPASHGDRDQKRVKLPALTRDLDADVIVRPREVVSARGRTALLIANSTNQKIASSFAHSASSATTAASA